jgi:hypothetical protein
MNSKFQNPKQRMNTLDALSHPLKLKGIWTNGHSTENKFNAIQKLIYETSRMAW